MTCADEPGELQLRLNPAPARTLPVTSAGAVLLSEVVEVAAQLPVAEKPIVDSVPGTVNVTGAAWVGYQLLLALLH